MHATCSIQPIFPSKPDFDVKVKESHYRPGQAQRVLRKLRFPDFKTTAQDGGRLSALRTGRVYPQEILLVLISVRVGLANHEVLNCAVSFIVLSLFVS